MTRCRVLFVLHSDVRAGLEEHVLSLLQKLSPQRFALGLACPAGLLDAMSPELDRLSVDLFPVEPIRWTNGRSVRRLWRILRQFHPDVVHCHLFRATAVGAPLARVAAVPVVVETYHGREFWRQGPLKRGFIADRLVSRCVDRIIAVSEAAARFLVDSKGIAAAKITVIPNGRNLDAFAPRNGQTRATMRKRLRLPDASPVLGVVGRLEEQKGHCFLLDALPQLLTEFPDTRLLLIGEGSLRAQLEAQAEQLGIRHAVIFVGFQHDVPAYIATTDVMVLPSLHEGMPLAAIETAAMGKPLVATEVGGVPEVVCHGTTGLLVPPATPAALADALLTLLRQPDLAARYGIAARAHARPRFDLQRQVAETEHVYLELLGRKR